MEKPKKIMQWYKYRYDELSGSGGTIGTSEWEYVDVPVIFKHKEDIADFIGSQIQGEYARLTFRKTSVVPRCILEERHAQISREIESLSEYAEGFWEMMAEVSLREEMKKNKKRKKRLMSYL